MGFLWLLDFRWWLVSAVLMGLALGFGFWQGKQYADKTAEINRLNAVIATSQATIEAMQEETRRSNQASAEYAKREIAAEQALAVDDEVIAALSEQQKTAPPETVCYYNDAEFNVMRDAANRASRGANSKAGATVNVRKASPRTPAYKK